MSGLPDGRVAPDQPRPRRNRPRSIWNFEKIFGEPGRPSSRTKPRIAPEKGRREISRRVNTLPAPQCRSRRKTIALTPRDGWVVARALEITPGFPTNKGYCKCELFEILEQQRERDGEREERAITGRSVISVDAPVILSALPFSPTLFFPFGSSKQSVSPFYFFLPRRFAWSVRLAFCGPAR